MSPPQPEVCVGAIVIHEDRVLLVRRGRGAGIGLWSVPGGRVEGGEAMVDAVAREVMEETGLQVVPGRWVGWVERIGEEHHFVIHDFTASLADGAQPESARAGDDASDVRWQRISTLADSDDLVPGLLDFLRDHGLA